MIRTNIDPALIQAYHDTIYHIAADPPFTMRVDVPSRELRALHGRVSVESSAFVTACNPLSQPLSAAENEARQAALAAELARCGWEFVPGEGRDPDGDWPGESSFLVLGLGLDDARSLGERHQQNAILWAGADALPHLILLR